MATALSTSKRRAAPKVAHPSTLTGNLVSYTSESITKKNANKELLLKAMGHDHKAKVLVATIFLTQALDALSKEEKKNALDLVEGLSHIEHIKILVVTPSKEDKAFFEKKKYHTCDYSGKKADICGILSGSDLFVFAEKNPQGIKDLAKEILVFGGTIVLWQNTAPTYMEEYNPFTEKGNAFFYTAYTLWNMFAEVIKVAEIYKFPYDWNTVRRVNMQSVE